MVKPLREESPTYQIGITGHLSKQAFQRLLHRANIALSAEQVGLLNTLLEKDGSSMQELSAINQRDNSATTRLVDNLIKKDLVGRRSSVTDRRIWNIFITQKGKEQVTAANVIGHLYITQAFKDIDKNELDIFMKVIKSIRKNITEIE